MKTSPVTHYHEGIWIERKAQVQRTLWEVGYYEGYTLVNDDRQPLHDEHHQEYLFQTLAQAEKKIQELLHPTLLVIAAAYAESEVAL